MLFNVTLSGGRSFRYVRHEDGRLSGPLTAIHTRDKWQIAVDTDMFRAAAGEVTRRLCHARYVNQLVYHLSA